MDPTKTNERQTLHQARTHDGWKLQRQQQQQGNRERSELKLLRQPGEEMTNNLLACSRPIRAVRYAR
jgi:hypothetical protein